MSTRTINIERKVWGASPNYRGDSVLAFTPHISRDADVHGVALNGTLPASHAALMFCTKPSWTVSIALAQGEFTRFDGMGRAYNMRAVCEVSAAELATLRHPMTSLLAVLDDLHEYGEPNTQLEPAVTVTDSTVATRLGTDEALLQRAIVTALMTRRKVWVHLPEDDALFGDAIRTAPHLRPILNVIDNLPARLRPLVGVAFGVETSVEAYADFIAQATVVAHFDEVAAVAGDIVLDWTGGTLTGTFTAVKDKPEQIALSLPEPGTGTLDRDKALGLLHVAPPKRTVVLPGGGDPKPATDDKPSEDEKKDEKQDEKKKDEEDEEKKEDEKKEDEKPSINWGEQWQHLVKSMPLSLIIGAAIALFAFMGGRLSQPAHIDVEQAEVIIDSAAFTVPTGNFTLTEHQVYDIKAQGDKPAIKADTLLYADMTVEHPMMAASRWNLGLLFRSDNVKVAFTMTFPNHEPYDKDTALIAMSDKSPLVKLNTNYYAALDATTRKNMFEPDVKVTLSDGTTLTIGPENTFMSATATSPATLASVTIGGEEVKIDNELFVKLNTNARGLDRAVYYLWAVQQMDSIRTEKGINKLIAY